MSSSIIREEPKLTTTTTKNHTIVLDFGTTGNLLE
jgi:hypothetical protein